jgi:hypothetical protein
MGSWVGRLELGRGTHLFELVVAHPLLAARCSGRHRSLSLLAASGGALCLLFRRLRLRPCGTLSDEHFVPQVVGQLAVLGTELAHPILGHPVVPAAQN